MGTPGPLPTTSASGSEIERLKAEVSVLFPVYETRITPQSLVLLVQPDPATLEQNFDQLRQNLWPKFYIPQLRLERGEYLIEIVRRPTRRPWGFLVNLVLLGLTVATTVTAGAFLWLAYVGGSTLSAADFLDGGVTFALPLLLILGVHEFAHYVVARRHRVEASLPFFIPVPPPFLLFGTFGAFISLRQPIPDKKALLDIGASGPIAGFLVSIPVTVYGMFLSAHAPVLSLANCGPTFIGVSYGNFVFGTSLFWALLGEFVPVSFINLSPVALAGWVGILVTAINLLPAGQLDGGHVFRALLGDRSRWVSYGAVALLFYLGLQYNGWFVFAVLILLLGVRHPPPLNDITRLDPKRWIVGAFAAAVLVSGFVVIPIMMPTGSFDAENPVSTPIQPPAGDALASNLSLSVVNEDMVAHGFAFNASIVRVSVSVNNSVQRLSGAALAAYEANSTWIVHLPNGNVSSFPGTGNFSLPSNDFVRLDAGATSVVTVTYSNVQSAEVWIVLTVSEVCAYGAAAPQNQLFTID
jgi:membrane-associated protease RseP (regulator of RpoE activity)